MDAKQVQPDPCDYKIICCSNALQCLACLFSILAIFVEQLREASEIINCIADLFLCSVGGCMGAQVHHEIKLDADGVKHHKPETAQGAPESLEMSARSRSRSRSRSGGTRRMRRVVAARCLLRARTAAAAAPRAGTEGKRSGQGMGGVITGAHIIGLGK